MNYRYAFFFVLLSFSTTLAAQTYKQRFQTIDIQHYKLNIAVNDSTNIIRANMNISMKFKRAVSRFDLDLESVDSTGKGMKIDYILKDQDSVLFSHKNNKITLQSPEIELDSTYNYTIYYHGIPKDGLIIGQNIHGDRTFFGDNWPNRAQHWFPCVDHPSDKATIEYIIQAPNHYQTVANGVQVEETNVNDLIKKYHWKTQVPLPTKVMVIGIARFAVQYIGETQNVPISTWVYPQTKDRGFYDFAIADKVLNYFVEQIDEYPYQKLANVQSKTRFGGMENAGAIFYYEKSVTGKRAHENLIVHEIAHQWFGNSASEADWPHLWLSEGFATYLTDLYVLKEYGTAAFQKRIQQEKATVISFSKKKQTPVVDTKTKNYMELLNANSYQKGAWVLHMLRKKIGDEHFWNGIRNYYKTYKFKNASTGDFKRIMSEVSGVNLDEFFKQWLFTPGHPILKTNWIYGGQKMRIIVEQTQETIFNFPLDLQLLYEDGTTEIKTIIVEDRAAPFEIDAKGVVKDLKLDTESWLLFEMVND